MHDKHHPRDKNLTSFEQRVLQEEEACHLKGKLDHHYRCHDLYQYSETFHHAQLRQETRVWKRCHFCIFFRNHALRKWYTRISGYFKNLGMEREPVLSWVFLFPMIMADSFGRLSTFMRVRRWHFLPFVYRTRSSPEDDDEISLFQSFDDSLWDPCHTTTWVIKGKKRSNEPQDLIKISFCRFIQSLVVMTLIL